MFAYCNNNPINCVDHTGKFLEWLKWIANILRSLFSGFDSDGSELLYETADAAAIAFSTEVYSATSYSRHEYSTEIYTVSVNEKTYYRYTKPAVGSPHSASGINMNRVPNVVAYAHTHPNGNSFSNRDIIYADYYSADAYFVGPNLELNKYDYSSGEYPIYVETISPTQLTGSQRAYLVITLCSSWYGHFVDGVCPEDFKCETKSWPNS